MIMPSSNEVLPAKDERMMRKKTIIMPQLMFPSCVHLYSVTLVLCRHHFSEAAHREKNPCKLNFPSHAHPHLLCRLADNQQTTAKVSLLIPAGFWLVCILHPSFMTITKVCLFGLWKIRPRGLSQLLTFESTFHLCYYANTVFIQD